MTDQSAARIEAILEERAQAGAGGRGAQGARQEAELVVLALGPERYGVDILQVQTIQGLSGWARVPGLPAFWAGLVNLRGRLYPVLNLRRFLALPGQPAEGGKVVLVAGANLSVARVGDRGLGRRRGPLKRI